MKKVPDFVSAVLLLGLWASGPAMASEQESPSLYDRLGGVYPIAVVVDDFIERLLVNDTLNANPAIKEARARVPAAGLSFHVTTLVCQATGGPCKYVGRDMRGELAGGGVRIKLENVNGRIEIRHAEDGRALSPVKDLGGRNRDRDEDNEDDSEI